MLGNYRPLTVIIAMSGLYSKVLNARLIAVVEEHEVLGEIQNGRDTDMKEVSAEEEKLNL